MDLGADALAVLLYRSAIEELEEQFGKECPEVIHCLNCLAEAQIRMGALYKAEQTCSDVLSRYTEGSALDASQKAISYSLAARIAEWLNKLDSAEAYYRAALYISTQTFGDAHPEVAKRAADLGVFCVIHHRDLAQAERLLRQALEIRQQALGREHPEMAESMVYLAMLCWEQKRHHEAEEYYQQALAIRRQKLGPYHPGVLQILHDLAELATEQYKDEEAEQYFREMLSLAPHAGGTKSYEYLMLLKAFVDFLRTRGRMEEALHYQEQITTLARQLATRRPLYSLDLSSAIGEGEEGLSGPWLLMS